MQFRTCSYLWKLMWFLFWLSATEADADKDLLPGLTAAQHVPSPPTSSSTTTTPPDDNQQLTLDIARRLESRLKYIRNVELCVPEIQAKFDSMDFVTKPRNDEEQLQRMAQRLEGKLKRALSTVESLELIAYATATKLSLKTETVVYPCPSRIPKVRRMPPISYNRDQIEILNSHQAATPPVIVEEDFGGQFYKQLKGMQFSGGGSSGNRSPSSSSSSSSNTPLNFKRQYLLAPHDNAIDNSCPFYFDTPPLRNIFVASIRSKRVLVLVDHGNSLNVDQLELTKSMAKQVVSLLSDADHLHIIAIADKVTQFQDQQQLEECVKQMGGLSAATMDNKVKFFRFIEQLNKTKENTNHSLGFQAAFDFLGRQPPQLLEGEENEEEVLFLYISRGLLSLAEAKTVLETIATGQSQLRRPVVINTCAIIIDEKRIMYERHFLRDITAQDYNKYSIDTTPWMPSERLGELHGEMFVATKRQSNALFVNATALYAKLFLSRPLQQSVVVHRPVVDSEMNRDLIVSVTKAVKDVGVVGVDLFLHDLAEDVLYYNKHPDSYAFLLDRHGVVIVHPTQMGQMVVVEGAGGQYHQPEFMYPTDVLLMEQSGGFFSESLRQRMLNESQGRREFEDAARNGTVTYSWRRTEDEFYILCIVTQRSNTAPRHPVELKRIHGNSHHRDFYAAAAPMDTLLYHRLDLLMAMMKKGQGMSATGGSFGSSTHKLTLCRNFKQISTFDAGTLFLSPSAFQSPFLFTKNMRNVVTDYYSVEGDLEDQQVVMDRIQALMAYLKDRTNLLANPGLLPQVRNDVVALSYIINHLRWKHLDQQRGEGDGRRESVSGEEELRRAIVRRYVATMNGVLEIYPGVQLDGALEPRRRPWFVKALLYPGKVVVTEPYLDAGGAGYIISVAYTIFEGKPNALHSPTNDLPVAVIGLDLTLGYAYKLMTEASAGVCGPLTSEGGGGGEGSPPMRCFLTDDKGYLVAHPSVLEPVSADSRRRRPLEHVTHRESQVANDMLNHKLLVEKRACNVYGNRTTQRYYQFNTSLAEVLTNVMVHGERNKYHIAAVPDTNLFLTIVNASTEGGAFCPCSTVDRLCLNCNRMEQLDCECPCECPLDMMTVEGGCGGRQRSNNNNNNNNNNNFSTANCDLPHVNLEEMNMNTVMPIFRYDFDEMDLHACPTITCDLLAHQWECLGVAGCEWCQLDGDGETAFAQPFCTSQASCYGGVLGGAAPYAGAHDGLDMLGENQLGATNFIDPLTPHTYSSIGPIAGAIIALCLVVGFAMYCYRQNQEPHLQGQPFEENFYVDSQPELFSGCELAMNRRNFEDPFDENGGKDGNNSNQNLIPVNDGLVSAEAAVSPYRAVSAYRRPNGDSDHGYSTMTPHDDSEHAGFTLADPLLNRGGGGGRGGSSVGNKRASLSDTISINTSVSSPTNYQKHYNVPLRNDGLDGGGGGVASSTSFDMRDTGALLGGGGSHRQQSPHHVLAPVTVHRQMEAS